MLDGPRGATPDEFPSAELVRAMAAGLRGEALTEERAAEVATDLKRGIGHARAVAALNDMNAEPGGLAAALARLARPARRER